MEDMRKNFLYYVAAFCGMVTLGSCAQEVINEDMSASDSRMTVMTRGEGDPVSSPVRLYVFDSNDGRVTMGCRKQFFYKEPACWHLRCLCLSR